jgi:hypothetical protein
VVIPFYCAPSVASTTILQLDIILSSGYH